MIAQGFFKRIGVGIVLLLVLCNINGYGQDGRGVSIGKNGEKPFKHAMLDVVSINKGVLVPRMTTAERENILFGANNDDKTDSDGLLVYDTNFGEFYYYSYHQDEWMNMSSTASGGSGSTEEVYFLALDDNFNFETTMPADFDLSTYNTLSNQYANIGEMTEVDIVFASYTSGQYLSIAIPNHWPAPRIKVQLSNVITYFFTIEGCWRVYQEVEHNNKKYQVWVSDIPLGNAMSSTPTMRIE